MTFESNVIYIGTKTCALCSCCSCEFESNVIYIGTKTKENIKHLKEEFESNVIYIGTKTPKIYFKSKSRLRVM